MTFSHVYAVCQVGSEVSLKAEVARLRPGWRAGFARPGLVTWRADAPVEADVALPAVFARCHGASFGPARDDAAVLGFAAGLDVLHVFERDRARPGEESEPYGALAREWRDRLTAVRPFSASPREGQLVLDVVVAPGEPALVGVHRHGPERSSAPGGRPALVLPADAPSRAWLKIEEAIAFANLPFTTGQTAVEIGSSPGGATHALLARGLRVFGVDPGEMDPRLLANTRLVHLDSTLADVRREQLPKHVDWLLCDVNLAPQVVVHQLRRLVSLMRDTLRGVVFTLKMNDDKAVAEIPALLERVRGMGLSEVRATQLPSNRSEICVIGRVVR